MCKCCTKDIKFEIDHIRSLASGGTNEKSNLQVLCKACHLLNPLMSMKVAKINKLVILKAHLIHKYKMFLIVY
jgi:5-methylcytosine-specific restriction endonuclease McrA